MKKIGIATGIIFCSVSLSAQNINDKENRNSTITQPKVPGLSMSAKSPVCFCCNGNAMKDGKDPLIILDGQEITSLNLNTIEPEKIKSVEVLKDSVATNSYGDKGKYGVLLVESKNGKEGKRIKKNMPPSVKPESAL